MASGAPGRLETTPTGSRGGPFLKWAGGKGQLLSQLAPYFPRNYGTYFEPFLGGGAVFFFLKPPRAELADLNQGLVNVYSVVKRAPRALMAALDRHTVRAKEESYFYEIRDRTDPTQLSAVERAARLVFLNKTCFNGLYRVNRSGEFNVPWGGYRKPVLYREQNIVAASAVLGGAKLVCADFQVSCARAQRGDLVYLDPPYDPLTKTSSFTAYTAKDFGSSRQNQLAQTFKELDEKGCFVMLSNSGTKFVRELYGGYRTHTLRAKRAINSKGTGRGAVDELLIVNFG